MAKKEKTPAVETQVHQALSGIPYPATKDELIKYASAKSGNGAVVDLLDSLPSINYTNEPQVLTTLREYK